MRRGLGGDEREGQCASDATHRYIGSIFIWIVVSEPPLKGLRPVPLCYARRIMSLPDLQGETLPPRPPRASRMSQARWETRRPQMPAGQ